MFAQLRLTLRAQPRSAEFQIRPLRRGQLLDLSATNRHSPAVLARLAKWLLVLALMFSIGAHWAVLQSVAWTTMIAANLSTDSFSAAVEKTFDGEHPCELCKNIKAGKKSEQKSEAPLELKKFEFVNDAPRFIFAAPKFFVRLPEPQGFLASLNHTPPSPPPRTA